MTSRVARAGLARRTAAVLVASFLGSPAPARAQNLLNSDEKPPSSSSTAAPSGQGKNQLTLVPAARALPAMSVIAPGTRLSR